MKKALTRLEGVDNVDVSIWDAQATFDLKSGVALHPAILRKAVADAGFTPREILINARGELTRMNGQMVFRPSGAAQVFTILESSENAKVRLETLEEVGLVAKVVGETSPYGLEIDRVQ